MAHPPSTTRTMPPKGGYGEGLQERIRVELHPATDRWMQGDRYGTIVEGFRWRGKHRWKVKMDRSGQTIPVIPENLRAV